MKLLPAILFFLLSSHIAIAGDEIQINLALQHQKIVYLDGTYNLDDQVILNDGNQLIGSSKTVLQVRSPFFTGTKSIVYSNGDDILIDGIEIDGNCDQFDNRLSSTPGHAHDNEKGMMIKGSSGRFVQNVIIRNCKIHDCFGDGITAMCVDGIVCENNTIINCQHEAIFYSACKNCKMLKNRMAVITSGGGRFDNCINGEAEGNIVWKYDGNNNNGAYKGGATGFQVADSGVSKGYDGRKSWISTKNVEIHDNVISDPGRQSIVLGSVSENPESNIFIHDNIFKNTNELRTMGIPVDDYSINNPPSVDDSLSVFDLLKHYQGKSSINDYQDKIKNDPVKTQEDKKAFFSPKLWLFLLIVIVLLYGIKTNLEAAFKW